ncbi:MAG TPA: DUF4446 family protein [Mobilitalea sp.]|nr:DUF4446 family protein [Mobilitalea sp.]
MKLNEMMNDNSEIIIIVLAALVIILMILIIVNMVNQHKLRKKFGKFMSGADAKNLEGQILSRFADIDILKADAKKIYEEIDLIKDNLLATYQKVGVVKYDAFKEMGGKLSFVLALLDKNNNGFLLNSVHSSREGCYTYMKEIIKGESFLELSADERTALNRALKSSDYKE